jgi:hypothetical protein
VWLSNFCRRQAPYKTMSSTIDSSVVDVSHLPASQQVLVYMQWLRDNPDHSPTSFIQQQLANCADQLVMKNEEQAVQLAKKDEELAKKDEELANNAVQLAKKDEELAKKDEVLTKRSLSSLRTEYPAQSDRTASGPHLSYNHIHANVHELDTRNAILSIQNNWLDEQFWKTGFFHAAESNNCSSESSAQNRVELLLASIICGLGLGKYVEVVEHRTLAGSECDILLVYRPNFLPFAVIEVKKPCNSNEGRHSVWFGETDTKPNVVAGQVFDAMTALQLYGFPQVCGMITTWNHWRLVGTGLVGTSNDLIEVELNNVKAKISAEAQSIDILPEILKRLKGLVSPDCPMMNDKESPEQPNVELDIDFETENTSTDENRHVWASKITPSFEDIMGQEESQEEQILDQVKHSGTSIISLVALFVVKSCKILVVSYRPMTSRLLWDPSLSGGKHRAVF